MRQHQPEHMQPWVEPMRARRRLARRNAAKRVTVFCATVPVAWLVIVRWLDKIL